MSTGEWVPGSETRAFESSSSRNGQGFLFWGDLLPLLIHGPSAFKSQSPS